MATWSRSGCALRLNSGNDERRAQRLRPTAARPVMQRDEDVSFLVSSVLCVCARLLCIARLENVFVDVVTRVHGHSMFSECLPVGPTGWKWIVNITIIGAIVLSCIPELVLGRYRRNRPG